MSYPLEGMRILDMSRVLAGPFAGRMLAELGADVVKVEPPDGDITRLWGASINDLAGYYHQQNLSKRDICVDLSVPEGKELIKQLVSHADALIENFRPGVMDRLGLGYEVLTEVNPGLVMLSISGFGADSPESGRAAYAPIIHAETGLMARQGKDRPEDIAVPLADTNASLHGLVALLSALIMRERTGGGQHIDLAMIDATLVTDDHIHYALEESADTKPLPSEVWDTATGPIIMAGDFRHIWRQLVELCGVVDPTPKGAAFEEKVRLRRQTAQDFFKNLPDRSSLVEVLDSMNMAWGDVRSGAGVFELPTIKHRGSITTVDDGAGGERMVVQSPYRFSNADAGVRSRAPHKGEHNDEVLKEWLSASKQNVDNWRKAGVLLDAGSL